MNAAVRPQAQAEAAAGAELCVVLHDVAPACMDGCVALMALVERLAREHRLRVPLTLLVVPCLHGQPPDDDFVQWLHEQRAAGHELALHGLTHRDEAPPPRSVAGHVQRRWLTDGEGEFAALGPAETMIRLLCGRAWARNAGLSMPGFVAPAWLNGSHGLQGAAAAGYLYACTRTRLVHLPSGAAVAGATVAFSSRTRWRRALSLARHRLLQPHFRASRLLRFELHPGDAEYASLREAWLATLDEALLVREPLTLSQAVQRGLRRPVQKR